VFQEFKTPMRCRKFEARLADYANGCADGELNEHLNGCVSCRETLSDARLAGSLLRQAWEPAAEPGGAFSSRVMARIREEKRRSESPMSFWNPLEFLASRMALTAATLLLALSAYLVGFAPHRAPSLAVSGTELRATDFPQVPQDPESNEDVLVSLSERTYER
jgi:hypothetical protein